MGRLKLRHERSALVLPLAAFVLVDLRELQPFLVERDLQVCGSGVGGLQLGGQGGAFVLPPAFVRLIILDELAVPALGFLRRLLATLPSFAFLGELGAECRKLLLQRPHLVGEVRLLLLHWRNRGGTRGRWSNGVGDRFGRSVCRAGGGTRRR